MIAQESLRAFINALSPGASSSITKVNFNKLDDFVLKPIGIYGSKEEIVRLLLEIGAVDTEMCVHLSTHHKADVDFIGGGSCSSPNVTT